MNQTPDFQNENRSSLNNQKNSIDAFNIIKNENRNSPENKIKMNNNKAITGLEFENFLKQNQLNNIRIKSPFTSNSFRKLSGNEFTKNMISEKSKFKIDSKNQKRILNETNDLSFNNNNNNNKNINNFSKEKQKHSFTINLSNSNSIQDKNRNENRNFNKIAGAQQRKLSDKTIKDKNDFFSLEKDNEEKIFFNGVKNSASKFNINDNNLFTNKINQENFSIFKDNNLNRTNLNSGNQMRNTIKINQNLNNSINASKVNNFIKKKEENNNNMNNEFKKDNDNNNNKNKNISIKFSDKKNSPTNYKIISRNNLNSKNNTINQNNTNNNFSFNSSKTPEKEKKFINNPLENSISNNLNIINLNSKTSLIDINGNLTYFYALKNLQNQNALFANGKQIVKKAAFKSFAGKTENGNTKTNQDSYLLMENILNCEDYFIYGVFDGHGIFLILIYFIVSFVYITFFNLIKENIIFTIILFHIKQ